MLLATYFKLTLQSVSLLLASFLYLSTSFVCVTYTLLGLFRSRDYLNTMTKQQLLVDYAKFFEGVGEPTMKSSAELRALQEARRRFNNPECFHLTVDPRPPGEVHWSYNTEYHLGHKQPDGAFYLGMFHPKWYLIFIAASLSALKIYRRTSGEQYKPDQSFNLMVPLRQANGAYYWYNMYTIPGAFDEKGRLTRHINVFQRICSFENLFPTGPKISINGKSEPKHVEEVKKSIEMVLSEELKQILTPSGYKILQAYRENCIFSEGKWHPLSHQKMGTILGKSRQALDRANVRLLQSARQIFPPVVLSSVSTLAAALNFFCGKPLEEVV